MNYYTIKEFDGTGLVKTVFTTKENDEWFYDNPNSKENFEKLAKEFDISINNICRVHQTHSANIKVMSKENGGEGVTRPSDDGIDGMVTNVPGLLLCTLQADCTPVYMLDKKNKAIAMVHSGWRGTTKEISVNAINKMKEEYGTNPEEVMVALGPSICGDCYEVEQDVVDEFEKAYGTAKLNAIFKKKNEVKFLLDVASAIEISLMNAGVKPENIINPPFCTFEDKRFPSYRRDHGISDRMLTGIMLV